MTTKPEAGTKASNFTMPEKKFPFGSNDLAPCTASCASPAQANHMTGLTPYHIENSFNRFFYGAIFKNCVKPSGLRHKDYLLHIYPFHSIW